MKKILFVLCGFLITLTVNAQSYETTGVREPKVSDMLKKSNTPLIGYTGNFGFEVPLHSIDEKSFSDNISLSYNASGFYPNKRDGEVGTNWSLNYGGMITRTVNGMPDEYQGQPTVGSGKAHGTYYASKVLPTNLDFNNFNNLVFGLSTSVIHPMSTDFSRVKYPGQPDSSCMEAKTDVFNFSMHGVSGKFYINSDGKPVVVANNNEKIKVNLDYMVVQNINNPYPGQYNPPVAYEGTTAYRSRIIMTLDNGFVYFFGGDLNTLSFVSASTTIGQSKLANGIKTWYLSKVISPDGDELIYEYDRVKFDVEGSYVTDMSSPIPAIEPPHYYSNQTPIAPVEKNVYNNAFFERQRTTATNGPAGIFGGTTTESSAFSTLSITEYTKPCYIRKIYSKSKAGTVSNLFKVFFYYTAPNYSSPNLSSFYDTPNITLNPYGRQLSQIKIYTFNDVLVKKFDFTYTVAVNRKFLNSITLNDQPYYNFEYYNLTGLPPTTTKGVDFWGFWNGKPDNQYLVPGFVQDASGNLTYTTDNRNPSATLYNAGMLQKVIYPTKGYTEFVYDRHQYSKRLERRSPTFLTALYPVNDYAGGARIQQIKDFDGTAYTNIRTFSYQKDDGSSSGILLDYPRYYFYIYQSAGSSTAYFERWRNTSFNSNSPESNYITYSQVTETNSDNSKIKSVYSNYETHPDVNDINVLQLTSLYDGPLPVPPFYLNPSLPELYKNYVGVQFNDLSAERGKLIRETKINPSGVTLEETEFTYNTNANRFSQFIPNLKATGGIWIQSFKIYTYPNYLTQVKTKQYFNGQMVENIKNLSYNSLHNYPVTISNSSSTGEISETKYQYPPDNPNSTGPPGLLVDQNRISMPVSTQEWKNGNKMSESTWTTWEQVSYARKYFYSSSKANETSTLLERHEYQGETVPVEIHSFGDGRRTSLIWGYDKSKIIARVENATYSDFQSQVGNLQTLSNSGPASEAGLITALNNLRNSLPNAQVTTYTYKPLIGVSTITDPRGRKTTYEYDMLGRLVLVRDPENNILSENKYNYKP